MFAVFERVGLTVVLSPYFYFLASSGHLFFVPVMRLYCAPNLAFFGLLKLGKRAVFFFCLILWFALMLMLFSC